MQRLMTGKVTFGSKRNHNYLGNFFLAFSLKRYIFFTILLGIGEGVRAQSPPPPEENRIEIVADESSTLPDNLASLLKESDGKYVYPEPLSCGEILTGFTGKKNDQIIVPIQIEEGIRAFVISMDGQKGDADLYLSYDLTPTLNTFEYRPYVEGVEEEIYLDQPAAGQWWLMIHGYTDFKGVQISVSCIKEEFEDAEEAYLEQQDLELALYYELSILDNTNRTENSALRGQVLNRRGRQAFTSGRFDEALSVWNEWMNLDPDNPSPITLIGDLYLRLDDVEQAVSFYRKSLELQPGQLVLMARLSRILDVQADKPDESRKLLNRFSRLFPKSPVVALAQAGWLIRRRQYDPAIGIIRRIIESDPENLNAMSLLHPLLQTPMQRYENMLNMLKVGRLPGRETSLIFAIREHDLLTRPESWVLMGFLETMAGKASTPDERQLYSSLLPREHISSEDFRFGRMSTNWVSSAEKVWGDGGNFILATATDQTEAFLRLVQSDAMHNAFVEAEIQDSRGFFWIYARRGNGNMIRFGFAESGELYLQVWLNNYLVTNETRMWSRAPGPATLRLAVRGDGAMGYINGKPAFGSPVSIPDEMGLGWWGIAPWSTKPGKALVSVVKISGGPLPVRMVVLPHAELVKKEEGWENKNRSAILNWLDQVSDGVGTLAPEWFTQDLQGDLVPLEGSRNLEMQLLARYHRMKLMPMVRVTSYSNLDLESMLRQAVQDKIDGYTLLVERMPDPKWLAEVEAQVIESGISLQFLSTDRTNQRVLFRELCGTVGTFPGPRRTHMLDLEVIDYDWDTDFEDDDPNVVLLFNGDDNL